MSDYIADNYGECEMGPKCSCLRYGWKGTRCAQWHPVKAQTFEELKGVLTSGKD